MKTEIVKIVQSEININWKTILEDLYLQLSDFSNVIKDNYSSTTENKTLNYKLWENDELLFSLDYNTLYEILQLLELIQYANKITCVITKAQEEI